MPDRENRERAIDRLLPQVLGGAPSAECVDGETLAAWTDGTLRQSDATRVEQHVADCARCQALLGAFVRISPPAAATDSLWQRWRLGWLLPLATAAAAVALWAVVPEIRPRQESQVSLDDGRRDTAPAPPPVSAPSSRPAPPVASPESPRESAADAAKPQELDRLAEPARRRAAEALRQTGRLAKQVRAETVADAEAKRRADETLSPAKPAAVEELKVEAARTAPPPPPASPAPAIVAPASPVAAAPEARVVGGAGGGTSAGARAAEQKPASNAAFARPGPAAEPAATAPVFRAGVTLVEVPTPVASTRWQLLDGRELYRTTTSGARWDAVTLPDGLGQLTAGSAPSADVCWIVGRSGRMFLTIDGRRFVRLAFPEQVDLVAVRATDARAATVTAADGRTFQTTDGGVTWR